MQKTGEGQRLRARAAARGFFAFDDQNGGAGLRERDRGG